MMWAISSGSSLLISVLVTTLCGNCGFVNSQVTNVCVLRRNNGQSERERRSNVEWINIIWNVLRRSY